MEKKENGIKKFVKEHKTEIRNAAIVLGASLVGCVIGCATTNLAVRKNVRVLNDRMNNVMNDAVARYSNCAATFTGISDTPLKADDLGKIGEELKKLPNYDERVSFTHFIGIGENFINK